MITLEINNLDFDVHSGPVGLACSGGADSSLMLYLMMKYCPGPIHVFTCASKLKHRQNPIIVLSVLDFILDTFPRTDVFHHVFFTDEQTRTTLFRPMVEFRNQNPLETIYTAGTALPPDDVLETFSNPSPLYELRNQNEQRPVYNHGFYSPWWNQDKKFIAEIYASLELTDTLLPLTRSCESFELKSGHCGQCWWCEERRWAFARL